ncbi:MAG: MHYT domain-containing protein [Wenzhouxiangellaceae bacterium]
MLIETQLSGFNPFLVFLSYVISVFGAYTALAFARESLKVSARERLAWISWGAVILGSIGVWAMHFVGMMAFDMGMPVNYNLWLTALSMVFVIAGCAVGFAIVGIGSRGVAGILAGGVVMGCAIGAMHYTGMLAMQMPAEVHWDRNIVVLSMVIAVVASSAALWMAFNLEARWQLIVAALVAGVAVCGMHYTGMFAWSYTMIGDHEITLPSALSPIVVGGGLFILSVLVLLLGSALTRTQATAVAVPGEGSAGGEYLERA